MLSQKSDAELEQLFSSNCQPDLSPKLQAFYDFFPDIEKELKRTGVTKQLMWEEYLVQNPEGLRRSQFMDRYMKWSKKVNSVMHREHKAGDKLFIDYAGKKLSVIDTSSTYCLTVTFSSREEHEKYQEEHGHKVFLDEAMDL